ncbi:MAG: Levodione reductase [Alphaproteobacteria bacterium MarineAlpha4_Bin2]|nr:MAG: Levodione reductase [Alphaproteobacteria bacterium MarineAlpha4_Bin2]
MSKLDGKVAIITGGSGGIGAAAAKLFAAEGAKVMLVDLDEASLTGVVTEIGEDKAACSVADVTDPAATRHFVDATLERFGQVDIALLNAGIEGNIVPIPDYPLETFDKVIDVNVRGVFVGLQTIMPEMSKGGGGSIVITSSTAGIRAVGGMSAYVASKHAVIGLMRTAAMEGAANEIRVNTINPSPIDTRMMSSIEEQTGLPSGDRSNRPMARHTPLQRYGEPEEVAQLMLFLSSDDSSFCTGGVYMVDGGVSAGRTAHT